MSEWWTYRLSDFLMFSPRTYYRMIERYNEALWPGHVVTLGLGLVMIALPWRQARWQGRLVSALLAALWAWVAHAFLSQRYAAINWAATYFAWLFAAEVVLLVWLGVVREQLSFEPGRHGSQMIGLASLVLSVAVYPSFAPLLGRGWRQAEVFGLAPDPTAIATLGLLLLAHGRVRWELLAVPVLWCWISGATLWAMGSAEAWVVLPASFLAIASSIARLAGRGATKMPQG